MEGNRILLGPIIQTSPLRDSHRVPRRWKRSTAVRLIPTVKHRKSCSLVQPVENPGGKNPGSGEK